MDNNTFNNFLETYLEKERKLLETKGVEYTAQNPDRLSAFKEIASQCGLESQDICQIFLLKHIQSINKYINLGVEGTTEGILERIQDARNYLLLLAAIIMEQQLKEGNVPGQMQIPEGDKWPVK